jgi:hypothetical protein
VTEEFNVDGGTLMQVDTKSSRGNSMQFWLLMLAQIWCAHALAYLLHEYAHSFCAWLLHCKANPLALDYGKLRVDNALTLGQIDENVDYTAIFAQGRGVAAAMIAFAGMGIGNGVVYGVCRTILGHRELDGSGIDDRSPRMTSGWRMFVYWLCLMCVGNFYDYVPIRTFTTRGDMAHIASGLNVSPWWIAMVLGIPTAWAIGDFFSHFVPVTLERDLKLGLGRRRAVLALSAFVIFVYFGASGIAGYGEPSAVLSRISVLVLFPLSVAVFWPRVSLGQWPR